MTPDRLTKLKKLMMLTTSDQDGEALSALRKANEMLKEAGISWEQCLGIPLEHLDSISQTIFAQEVKRQHKQGFEQTREAANFFKDMFTPTSEHQAEEDIEYARKRHREIFGEG